MSSPIDFSHTIAGLRPGDHLCCIYATEDEHRAVLTPFLRLGLERNEKVLYIVDFHIGDEVLDYLRRDGLSVDEYLARGQLNILTVPDAYMRDGVFSPDRMIALLRAETHRALSEGFSALRVTGEMSWALRGLPGSERLIEYEAKLNDFFAHQPCLAICQYDRRRFSPALLLDVITTHPLVVIGTTIYDNFYYMPPEDFLQPDRAAVTLQHWLRNLAERHSAARWRSFVENAPVVVTTIDRAGTITFINQPATNRTVEQVIGTQIDDYLSPGERGKFHQVIDAVFASGQPAQYESQIVRANGEVRWYDNRVGLLTHDDQDGSAILVSSDITDRKQLDQILQARVHLMEYALTHTLDELLIATLDEAGALTGSPIGFYHFLAADQNTLSLQAWSTRTTAEFCKAKGQGDHYAVDLAGVWVDCIHARRPVIHNDYAALPHRKGLPPGHAPVVRELAVPVMRGDLITAVLGVGNKPQPYTQQDVDVVSLLADLAWDIAERKWTEAALRKQSTLTAALHDATAALTGTLNLDEVLDRIVASVDRVVPHEATSILLLDGDRAYAVRHHTAAAASQTLNAPSEIYVSKTYNLRVMRDTRRPVAIGDVTADPEWIIWPGREWIRSFVGAPICIGADVIGFLNLYSGTPGFFDQEDADQLRAFADEAALAFKNAQLHTAIQSYADRLEQRVADRTRELSEANARLQELDRLKDQFISRISHELRTPLTSIKIHLDLLEHGKSEKRAKYLGVLNEQSDRLQRLIEELLDISDLDLDAVELHISPIDVNRLVNYLLADRLALAGERDLSIVAQFQPDLPPASADEALLVRAVSSLLSNALSYTPRGGAITIRTAVQARDAVNWITLTIADTGPGLSEHDRAHLFDRFYRGDAARDYIIPGAGLGLAICKAIADKLSGAITVESEPGHGAAFTIWLKAI